MKYEIITEVKNVLLKIHPSIGGKGKECLQQNPYELSEFIKFIKRKKIKTYLEIGTFKGELIKLIKSLGLTVQGIDINPRGAYDLVYKGTSSEFAKNFENYYDLIFVDGDHSYEGVMLDYNLFKKRAKYMAFHDICGLRNTEGCKIAWQEIKQNHKNIEIIDTNKNQKVGIGIIWLYC